MERTITVKGTGHISLKPDQTVITMTLRTVEQDYDRAIRQADDLLEHLREALSGIGFGKEELKTTRFDVSTEYESLRDPEGNYRNVFRGYAVVHGLKLEFDLDAGLLSRTLSAIAGCVADPELSVQFTVRDKDALSEALLEDAARNARRKAEILTRASGVSLGSLVSICYDWEELSVFSPTQYRMETKCMAMGTADNFTPDDVELNDSAAFVWEIRTE